MELILIARGFIGERRDSTQLYRAAMRHSRIVRILRIGVPAVLVAALLLTIGANYLSTATQFRIPGELGKLVINGTKVTMQRPHLTGYTSDAHPYDFHAEFAEQDITKPDLMGLHKVQGKVELEDKNSVSLTSNSGVFDLKAEMLTLTDSVHISSTSGYEAKLSEVTVDIQRRLAHSEKPVWVRLDRQGIINANSLDITDGGDVLRFGGGVSMVLQGNSGKMLPWRNAPRPQE
jgi:lipopolysaccharide export system protein LptC